MLQTIKKYFSPIEYLIRFIREMRIALTNDPLKCCEYAEKELNGRFLLGEEVIAKNAKYSLKYAENIIKGRFEIGEKAIAKNAHTSYYYAAHILKGRFEAGEAPISVNSECSLKCAVGVIKGRFELGEEAISRESEWSHFYALEVIKSRFELGEKAILEDVDVSRDYLSFLLTLLDKQKKIEINLKNINNLPNCITAIETGLNSQDIADLNNYIIETANRSKSSEY